MNLERHATNRFISVRHSTIRSISADADARSRSTAHAARPGTDRTRRLADDHPWNAGSASLPDAAGARRSATTRPAGLPVLPYVSPLSQEFRWLELGAGTRKG